MSCPKQKDRLRKASTSIRPCSRPSLRTHLSIRAGDYDYITVRIAEPDFSVLGCRVDLRFKNHFSAQFSRSINRHVKIVDLEPQYQPVPGRRGVRIDEVGMILFVPGVELKNQSTRREHPVINVTVRVIRQRVCR